ncbi:MAG TPA: RHS repeat-associated core domain-containing protein, partial [Caldilineaceae bacterium]|nr:RHS repeat-associated core domain-containing protein [Caldilineaceae bacterium]
YYQARYYDPAVGQFLSPDSMVPDPTVLIDYNRYAYARANPLKYNDPTGHCPICLIPIMAGLALMLSADSALPPEEAAATQTSGQIGASLVAGDINDVVTVAMGHDYITNQPVPYFSSEWNGTVVMAILPIASASTVRAIARTTDVAFGFTRNLGAFKRIVPQAQNYMDLGLDPYADEFADNVLEMMNNADNIHFDISNMMGLTGDDGVLTGAVQFGRGSTNWELRTIWDDADLMAKTTFYRYGKEISVEEILQLQD